MSPTWPVNRWAYQDQPAALRACKPVKDKGGRGWKVVEIEKCWVRSSQGDTHTDTEKASEERHFCGRHWASNATDSDLCNTYVAALPPEHVDFGLEGIDLLGLQLHELHDAVALGYLLAHGRFLVGGGSQRRGAERCRASQCVSTDDTKTMNQPIDAIRTTTTTTITTKYPGRRKREDAPGPLQRRRTRSR